MSPATPRLMVIILAATGIVVAGVVALALDSWLVLGALLVLHAIATGIVVGYTFKRVAEDEDKPDPVVEARLEEERAGTSASP
jgi:membrane protein implicated in regulation of membrane protease activity